MTTKIACISTDWGVNEYREKHNLYGGVGYYRIFKPYTELKNLGYKVDLYNKELKDKANKFKGPLDFWNWFTKEYQVVISKAVDNPNASAHLCFMAKQNGCKVILDLDDNYFEVNPNNPAYKYYYPGSQKKAFFAAFLSQVDGVICSTKPLADYYHEHILKLHKKDTPCFVFPNFNDIKDWPKSKKVDDGKIRIGWAGSMTHDDDLRLILPAISRLMKENTNIIFEMTGGLTPETAPKVMQYFDNEYIDRVAMTGGTNAWEGYPELLMKKGWDIGVAPLINDEFNRGKSHIKWMEYAMAKIPCVASRVYPYFKKIDDLDTIVEGETGYLAIDGLDFYKKLKILVENKELREKIGQNAYDYIKDNWQWTQNIQNLDKIIQQIKQL